MPVLRIPFNHAVLLHGGSTSEQTSGDITVTGYLSADRLPGEVGGIMLYFDVPANSGISKRYWKGITYKGYSGFKAFRRPVGTKLDLDATSVNNSGYADFNGKYVFGESTSVTHAVITATGALMNSNYNDAAVERNIAYDGTVTRIYMYISPINDWNTSASSPTLEAYKKYTIMGIENSYLEIEYEPIGYDVIPVFPVNVGIQPSRDNNFAYQITPSEHMRDSFAITSSKLTIHQNGNDYEYDMSAGETYVRIPANTLSVGPATYDIIVDNNYDLPNTSGIVSFFGVGASEAPIITGVTEDAFPVVSWESTFQIGWQLIIRGAEGIVFDSGMRSGNETSYKITDMLANGAYYAELRILNKYGYYTDWGTFGFTLDIEAPNAPTNIIVSVTNDYGVAVNCETPDDAGTLFVVRRLAGTSKEVIVGEYTEGFVDYTIPINTTFEYTVRNYSVGCADGEWIDATVYASGIIIRDGRDITKFINLWKVEDGEFNLISNNVREKSLIQCVGRTYPVKESSEWINSTRAVEVFVPYESYERLLDMATNSKIVYLQNRKEFLSCDMELSDQGEYITNGRITQILLTRIDEV